MSASPTSAPWQRADVALVTAAVVDVLFQIALIAVGLWLLIYDGSHEGTVSLLVLWCVIASLYWALAAAAIAVAVRRPAPPSRVFGWFERMPAVRGTITAATFLSSIVGLVAAVELLVLRHDADWSGLIEGVAVWAMLLSWALFHWGFARIYDRRCRSAVEKQLGFPGTDEPRLADFVYFSFTNATAFSVSDVTVLTTRMRFTVVWHTTLSFFFNALIIVLAVNTIIS
ncbi:DUF1345 domain-containing protein [Microbacterium sp. P02]|uniref:DUF1345 domain-containing protein n=1 Tax=Microbacterium sp. P02 TaxID=3366260 RepID=UPI00366AD17D